MEIKSIIKTRTGTASDWENSPVTLQDGEPGYDKENNILKIGDGQTSWVNLPSLSCSGSGGGAMTNLLGLCPLINRVLTSLGRKVLLKLLKSQRLERGKLL